MFFQCKSINYYFLFILIILHKISSQSIIFSYRTCLPNIDLINIEHYYPLNSQYFKFTIKDFRLHVLYTYKSEQIEYKFGNFNLSLPYPANFDHEFQTAIDYYHEIDTWHYVNITFNDYLSKVLISFNGDDTRLIPLVDYPIKNFTTKLNVSVLLDEQHRNVICLLPYSGFDTNFKECSINIKTCEYQTCTSTNHTEQYCPLFKIFDCRPFTDSECGLKTIPVRCLYNHCENGGFCYVDLLREVTQCVCPSGFAGDRCQYSIDECQSSPCPNHSHCIDLPNSYQCVCDPGWTGIDCSEDIDECKTKQPCKAARACINLPGTYKCDCLDTFDGQNCEMTLDPCLSDPCLNDAIKCHPIVESDNVVFRCTCRPGFTGHRCETNINDCEGIICPKNNTHCVDGLNSFDCQCKPNYTKNADGICSEQNPCHSSPCHSNATCYNLKGGQYRCMCPPTYTGIRCDEDIDECTVFPSICRNGGTCVNEVGSFRCYCPPGWVGSTCTKVIDYCLSQPCNRNGTCLSQINGFQCRCPLSHTGDLCQYDVNECNISPCFNNGTCHNYDGGFYCHCPTGYYGKLCENTPLDCQRSEQKKLPVKCIDNLCIANDTEKLKQIDQLSLSTCKTGQDLILDEYFTCIKQQPSDQCSCPSDLISCDDDTLQTKSTCNCGNGGTCIWLNSTDYRCYCPYGFTGPDCLNEINHCSSQPCYNNATCLSNSTKFTCRCSTNSKGIYCQDLIDPCESNPCLNNGRCQRETKDKYKCNCTASYTGQNCEIHQTPCLSQPCQNNGICIDDKNNNNTFQCQCKFNYKGIFCEQTIDLCKTQMNKSLCLNGGRCQVNNHTIQCACLPGFTGLFCETNIDECYTKPCSPNGECLDLINGYQCQCKTDWVGYNCDRSQNVSGKSLISRKSISTTVFNLKNSYINISKVLPYRYSLLPLRIQYEFRTTLNWMPLLSMGKRFRQEIVNNQVLTVVDNQLMLSTYIQNQDQWIKIIIEITRLWIDVRIGENSMSQRFYLIHALDYELQQEIVFGYKNYSGCVQQIEITYNQVYSILLTDQLVELSENLMLGCERTNACKTAVCQKNEICHDHWLYYTCQCQSPFFGEKCDQIAPIILFNQSSFIDISSLSSPIANISFFFNTLQPNGTLFQLISSPLRSNRLRRDLTLQNRTLSKILGSLINGRFHLIVIDNEFNPEEYELFHEKILNDGQPHQIQLDLNNNQLIIDRINIESLTNIKNKIIPKKLQLIPYGSLDGWLQDLRVNDRLISLINTTIPQQDLNITVLNMKQLENNPCYPYNPCQNHAQCIVTNSFDYLCECEANWFGQNCSQIDLCNYNNSNLCPNGFYCKTTDNNQECLAVGTFEGNTSTLIGILNYSSLLTSELSFRLRANTQSAHLFTIRNLLSSSYFSFDLFNENLIYRDSTYNRDLLIELHNQTLDEWRTFHFQWSNESTLIFNHTDSYLVNITFDNIFILNNQIEIIIGSGFRGCLDYVLLGDNLYVPFYSDILIENDTRANKFSIESLENIHINNCTFNNICDNLNCNSGQCIADFDRGKCLCNHGWEGTLCDTNIDECSQGHNCSKEHGICEDQLGGYYTCKCHQGFTGTYCETNIDECASSPCANGGICIDLINDYRCNCTNNYISSNCSVSLDDTCFGRVKSCQNNGTCLLKSLNLFVDNPETECQCQDGYSGPRCEIDLCSLLNCQNDGTCQRLPKKPAKCLCKKQWYGPRCQFDVDECSMNRTNICLNNGTCSNYPGGYKCHCGPNYLGEHCEQKHICLEKAPCFNHGQCRPEGEHYYCECLSSFTGKHCELPTCESTPCKNNGTCTPNDDRGFSCNCTGTGYEDDTCTTEINECLDNPCQNNASCIDQIGGYICACPRGFVGFQCESKKFLGSLELSSYHYIIWPGIAVLLLISIVLITIIIGRVRESRRSRGTYRPALNENGQTSRVEFSMILKPPPEERLI